MTVDLVGDLELDQDNYLSMHSRLESKHLMSWRKRKRKRLVVSTLYFLGLFRSLQKGEWI